mmetsp:Transcript_18410/g.69664  ORF Transcript_18410/g.69664 Transcript_18410/m.69664 type:complete len:321 (+) Transcript_18410:672-1634(+)
MRPLVRKVEDWEAIGHTLRSDHAVWVVGRGDELDGLVSLPGRAEVLGLHPFKLCQTLEEADRRRVAIVVRWFTRDADRVLALQFPAPGEERGVDELGGAHAGDDVPLVCICVADLLVQLPDRFGQQVAARLQRDAFGHTEASVLQGKLVASKLVTVADVLAWENGQAGLGVGNPVLFEDVGIASGSVDDAVRAIRGDRGLAGVSFKAIEAETRAPQGVIDAMVAAFLVGQVLLGGGRTTVMRGWEKADRKEATGEQDDAEGQPEGLCSHDPAAVATRNHRKRRLRRLRTLRHQHLALALMRGQLIFACLQRAHGNHRCGS